MTNAANQKPLVLIVDDSVDVHRLLRARLRHEQIRLVAVTGGREALEHVEHEVPSTILLDLDMPEMSGFEVLRALKENPRTHNVPVIMLSGMAGSEDKVTAFDLGAQDYVTKPFDLSELRARLRAALRLDHLLGLLATRADVDGLTGMGNRAHFDKRWRESVSGCERYKQPLSLALFDLDHFKSINDTYGHPAGDEVLQGFAELLQEQCRESDIPCRYGGEEFALIMPGTATEDAAAVADRVREKLSELTWARHPERGVTVSIGVAGSTGTFTLTAEQWIEKADQCMYAAKRGGRNQVNSSSLSQTDLKLSKAG